MKSIVDAWRWATRKPVVHPDSPTLTPEEVEATMQFLQEAEQQSIRHVRNRHDVLENLMVYSRDPEPRE